MDSRYLTCPFCYDGYAIFDTISNIYYCSYCYKELKVLTK